MREAVADREQRWSAFTASLAGWLLPATAARRSAHVRLRWAFVSHLVAALLTVLLVCVMAAWANVGPSGSVLTELEDFVDDGVREAGRHPKEFFAILAGSVVGIELGYVISALLMMAWGAADEPIRSSFAHALRRLWLHTWHALVAVFVVGVPAAALVQARTDWWRTSRGDRGNEPWYLEHNEEIIVYACFAAATWILWALLRAIGADRGTPPIARPPTCETCGYNLTATPMESRCPECGETVVSSLGPAVRPGTLWQRRREVGWLRAWWRCGVDVMVRAQWFGRQLETTSAGADHRFFLARHLVLIFFIGAAGIIMCYVVATGWNPLEHEAEVVWVLGPCVGYFTSAFMLFGALLAAGLVGMGYHVVQRRNLMGPAMQAASYLGGYLTLWALFAASVGIIIVVFEDWFDDLRKVLFIDDGLLMFSAWLLPNLACLALYLLLVWRATAGARYANR